MMQDKYFVTKDGLKNLKKELKRLKENEKPQAIERVKKAREMGYLDDNPEYEAAREEQSLVEGRIEELEDVIANAKIVEEQKEIKGVISIGSKVKVEIDGKRNVFTIVGSVEADPALGKISHESPVGQALLGLKAGDTIKVKLPGGEFKYKILEIV
ncbi:MAG: Transcription elongation factor GreA [candidate division CPR1 bacterium GW2011_GWA2_42_17]|uniref:Transcription elongation factor GreA n=1 Tax=candidate division CPR1 bacterium GW2011_GWA2_42_17 TaxID=1618341 RepID=A0A0G0Z618_9BACT|nr:MAG: Transcription elongation factor GreA [candidate division CPR1 bacterium GW2011_GWA2_42_17]